MVNREKVKSDVSRIVFKQLKKQSTNHTNQQEMR